ncbi:hypothetical protein FACS189485_16950 [Spirochaetia bacterium]|nr:hypothetical protein FACS189485_16950 [Spirochaetia bacterium]
MKIIILIGFCLFIIIIFFSCTVMTYYEDIKNKDSSFFDDEITSDGLKITITHLLQAGPLWLPGHDFLMHLKFPDIQENFQMITVSFDIYTINGKIIEPVADGTDIASGDKLKGYKYSIFFPKKIKEKIGLKFYYNGEYYEYSREVELIGKGDRIW